MDNELDFIKYGLIAVQAKEGGGFSVLHFCGYGEPPSEHDIESLYKELQTDPEFKIDGHFKIITAPQWMIEDIKTIRNQETE